MVLKKRNKWMHQEHDLLDQHMKFQKVTEVISQDQAQKKLVITKLPKLEITKFDRTFGNLLPFWNKFET